MFKMCGAAIIIAIIALYFGRRAMMPKTETVGVQSKSSLVLTSESPLGNGIQCLHISLEDSHAIDLKRLTLLEYAHQKKQKQLRIVKEVAAKWRQLGVMFGQDVDSIAQGHVMGKGYAEECCRDVLTTRLHGGAQGYPVTWKGFMKALRDIQMARIALNIEEALNCVITQ